MTTEVLHRCPECEAASNADVTMARIVPIEAVELIRAAREMPWPTVAEDRALWQRYALTRPDCSCKGSGYAPAPDEYDSHGNHLIHRCEICGVTIREQS